MNPSEEEEEEEVEEEEAHGLCVEFQFEIDTALKATLR